MSILKRHARRSVRRSSPSASVAARLAPLGLLLVAGRALAQTAAAPAAPTTAPTAASAVATRTATTADFRWLVGTWKGGLAGSPAYATVTYNEPDAGLMTGVMHLVDHGAIQVVELITLVDTHPGVELRFRHFSAGLEAMESTFKQSMRLTSHDATRDVFENAVPFEQGVMSTAPRTTWITRHGADEMVARSDIIDTAGKPAVIEVTYHRVP